MYPRWYSKCPEISQIIARLSGIAVVALVVSSCAVKTYKDPTGRVETYGFMTIEPTPIYESEIGVKVIGRLPKYYSFHIPKRDLKIENGLLHVRYDTGSDDPEFPNGWVELNNVKVFVVWRRTDIDAGVQKEISAHQFPVIAAKSKELISDFDKHYEAWQSEFKQAIKKGEVLLGMTADMVLLAIGLPNKVNKTKGNEAIEEQWIYTPSGQKTHYVYFKNGTVVHLQVVGENKKP